MVNWNDICVCLQQVYNDGQELSGSVDEFEQTGKELLDVVMDEDRQDLQTTLSSLVARWKVQYFCVILPYLNV